MRFNTGRKRGEKVTHYIMVGASKFNFIVDREANKCKYSFAGQTDRCVGLNKPEWSKFSGLSIRDIMEYGIYLDRYKSK